MTDFAMPASVTSSVISIELLDENGDKLKIENLANPILIKIYSTMITNNTICKYFDENNFQWKEIPVKERQFGSFITCETTHLETNETPVEKGESNEANEMSVEKEEPKETQIKKEESNQTPVDKEEQKS